MNLSKQNIVDMILRDRKNNPSKKKGEAYAPVNFALIKYWGKDKNFEHVMMPFTSHLSVSMKQQMGTKTILSQSDDDVIFLNGKQVERDSKFYQKAFAFIDLFRDPKTKLKIETENTVPTAAGLASSASGFAALTLALHDLYAWDLSKEQLSVFARLGSGSASRSVYQEGFVEFVKGTQNDTLDSVAKPFQSNLKSLAVGLLIFNAEEKKISSSVGMKETVEKSRLYKETWEQQVADDLKAIKQNLLLGSFDAVGRIAQRNALAMHATMHDAGITYSTAETLGHIEKLIELQKQGVPLYFTQDAGPNLKLLAENLDIIRGYDPNIPAYDLL